MKLDKHPKSVVFIMSALGVFVIGVVLTLAFFDNTSLLGVGVAMAVVGGAGAILGCINLMARRDNGEDTKDEEGVAPTRIPPPKEFYYQESYEDANQGDLYYEPCTASPSRSNQQLPMRGEEDEDGPITVGGGEIGRGFFDPNATAGGIIFVSPGKNHASGMFPLSPPDRRSYPIPKIASPYGGVPVGGPRQERFGGAAEDNGGVDVTRHVDPVSTSRTGSESAIPPWVRAQPHSAATAQPIPSVTRRVPFQQSRLDDVGLRTPHRGGEALEPSWSPSN